MDNIQEKSILVKELEENEVCEIQYKEGKLLLNHKDITNMKNELFKILKQSILQLHKSLNNQEMELKELFGEKILQSNIIKSVQYLNTQTDNLNNRDDNNNNNNGDMNYLENENKNNQQITQIPLEIQEELENNIIQKSYENILIQQYFSIISTGLFVVDNQNTQQQIQNQQKQQNEQEQYLQNQENIQYNLKETQNLSEMISYQQEIQSEIIQFISPLNQRKNNKQIFDLKYKGKTDIYQVTKSCELCDDANNNNKIGQMNKLLQKIQKIFVYESLHFIIGIDSMCYHLYDEISVDQYSYPNLKLEFGDLSNLKYYKLILEIDPDLEFQSFFKGHHQIIIFQDNYLKCVQLELELLPYIEIKQKQNQFLSSIHIISYIISLCDEEFNYCKIQEYLNNIHFSELLIIYKDNQLYKLRDQESLDYISLLYVRIEEYYSEPENIQQQQIQLINERYTNALCFFTLHKLFNQDFSIFRLAYDLYDQP